MNYKLFEFYEKHLFRKLKLNGYWNRLKSEQKLINQTLIENRETFYNVKLNPSGK